MGYEKQIGIIVPSSGIVTEMLFHRYAPSYIGISTARVKFNHISFQGLSDMLDLVGGAAADLCCVEPDIIVFSSIMAGAINGKSITNIVEQSSGTPCITGFYAMLEAINTLGIKHPAVLSPHTEELNLLFKRKMLQNGVRLGEIYRLAHPGSESSIRMMEQISMVFQNVYLFADTIENNIKFGRPDATHAEVVEAARKACCGADQYGGYFGVPA